MERRDFGTWGIELSEVEFARALAALGLLYGATERGRDPPQDPFDAVAKRVTQPRAILRWALPAPPAQLQGERPPVVPPAALLAAWFEKVVAPANARLEIDRLSPLQAGFDPPSALPWIARTLSHSEVKARSVYIRMDEPDAAVGWQWPLRVGLLNNQSSALLRRRLEELIGNVAWLFPLVTLVEAIREESDLLLVPGDVRRALATVAALPVPPTADCIVVQGHPEGISDRWYRMLTGLRATAHTSGVVLAGVAVRQMEDWFANLVGALSHNNPLDVALFDTARYTRLGPPVITASRHLMEFSLLSSQLRRMGKRFRAPGLGDQAVELQPGSRASRALGVTPGRRRLREIGERLEQIAEQADHDPHFEAMLHETGAATGAAELVAAAREVPEPSVTPEARFIQSQIYDITNPREPVRRQRCFRAGAAHEVVVRVGPPQAEWAWLHVPFPYEQLPKDQDHHPLLVIFSEPRLAPDPQLARIVLPRVGASTPCSFYLLAREEFSEVEGRIVVVHRNRVLQTAILRGRIQAEVWDVGDPPIALDPEVMTHQQLGDLRGRQRFAAAMVLNHDGSGAPGITAISDDRVARFTPSPTMRDEMDNLDKLLTQIVYDPRAYMGDLESKANVDLLRKLANHGSLLYDHLVHDGGVAEAGLAGDGPLQVVSTVPDARLPVEFVYARRAPKDDAPLCPNTAEALRTGSCDPACPQGQREDEAVCPLAFWGLRRVIERHSFNRTLSARAAGEEFALQAEPGSNRNALPVLKAGLAGGSHVVDQAVAGGLQQICDVIAQATQAAGLTPVKSWADWVKAVADSSPTLLLLMVHTEQSPTDPTIPQMEIGDGSWLTVSRLETEHIKSPTTAPPPLVLMLGCETGVSDKDFANFINRLRNRGAGIIVATGAKIHSLHAVPLAKTFVQLIQNAVDDPTTTFGEVMLRARRTLLADGLSMVLTLTAFGDADWRLARH